MKFTDGLEQREGEKLFTMYLFVQVTKKEFMTHVREIGKIINSYLLIKLIIHFCGIAAVLLQLLMKVERL